jgi:hypothetical protein
MRVLLIPESFRIRLALEDLPTALAAQVIIVDAADVLRPVNMTTVRTGPSGDERERL